MLNPDIQPFKPFDPGVTPSGGLNIQQGQQETNGQLDQEMQQDAQQWAAQYIQDNFGKGWLPTSEGWSKLFSEGIQSGALTIDDVYNLASQVGATFTPLFEKYLNNLKADENAKTEFDREIYARDTSIESTLNQLRNNQMSSGLLSSLGGASAGINTSAASSDMSNVSQGRKMAEFNRKTQMAKTMIGLLGGMASAGIYGGSVLAGKNAVAKLTTDASKEVARIRSAGNVASARVRLNARVKGKSRYDRFGNFISHEDYTY